MAQMRYNGIRGPKCLMEKVRTKVREGGRIIIPAEIRNKVKMNEGETVEIEVHEENSNRISTREQSLLRAQELFRKRVPKGVSLADELIADRRKEASNE